jgi:hypothetical protein
MILTSDTYAIQPCRIHNTVIYYFINNKLMSETQCWDCRREANQKKTKVKIQESDDELEQCESINLDEKIC